MARFPRSFTLPAFAAFALLLAACGSSTSPRCGDGTPQGQQLCVTPPVCGNGIKEGTEQCDDGNRTDGDGCESDCTLPVCGNGIKDGSEQCDDGNQTSGDGCENDCTLTPPPSDVDGDGVPDATDNCPSVANADQADSDGDGIGDACEACPHPNPGNGACPVSIYELKTKNQSGQYPYEGMQVTLTNQLVTAVAPDGFFLQVPETDGDYAGPDNSAIFVSTGSAPAVTAGDRVNIASAVPTSASGPERLSSVSGVTTLSSGNSMPVPIYASSADLADNGARALALDSALVTLQDATVTDTAPTPGPGDDFGPYEFIVDGSGLRVDDELYAIAPRPQLNEVFYTLVGIHDFRYGHYRLEPRDASDVVFGPVFITGFAPAFSYLDVGQTNAQTYPQPLTVTISRAQTTDTFVTIDTNDPNALIVPNGGVTVPAGQTSATVLVNGLQQSNDVTLTATLGPSQPTADVRVIDRAYEVPSVVSLSPSTGYQVPGNDAYFTVTLDMPAPAGGTTVDLAISPGSGFGTMPASVNVPAGELSATFAVTLDAAATGSATVTASTPSSLASASLVATFPASLRFTELNPAIASGKDLVELVVVQDGRLGGTWLVATGGLSGTRTKLVEFPDVAVTTGDVVLVHLNSGSGCTETSSPSDCPASSNGADGYVDTAWDIAATSSIGADGLEGGAGVLDVSFNQWDFDGIPYSDASVADAWISSDFPSWVQGLESSGVWRGTCTDLPSCRASAIQIGGIGDTTASSVQMTDTNQADVATLWTAPGPSGFGVYP